MARIAELEQKLTGIVSSLTTNNKQARNPEAMAPAIAPLPHKVPPISPASFGQSSSSPPTLLPATGMEAATRLPESGDYYDVFRARAVKYFPILYLPADAEALRRKRPFLFLCVQQAALHCTQTKLSLGCRIKQTVARRLVTDEETGYQDIDILLGLLTYVVWGHDNLLRGTTNSPNLSRLTQQAVTLACEMGLNKPIDPNNRGVRAHQLPGKSFAQGYSILHTMDDRRAVLGCYLLSSIISVYFGMIEPMPWTPHMESVTKYVSKSLESKYDSLLAHIVRLQRISADVEVVRRTSTGASFYDAGFRFQLEALTRSMSPIVDGRAVLIAARYNAELSVEALGLAGDEKTSLDKIKCLHRCLVLTSAALKNIFDVPTEDYTSISYPFFTQLASVLAVLMQLSTMQDPSWDVRLARETEDIMGVFGRLIANLRTARTLQGAEAEGGFLEKVMGLFRTCEAACAAKLAEGQRQGQGQDQAQGQMQVQGGDGMFDDVAADISIADWFTSSYGHGMLGVGDLIL